MTIDEQNILDKSEFREAFLANEKQVPHQHGKLLAHSYLY